jgi:Uma2 family endonuclease
MSLATPPVAPPNFPSGSAPEPSWEVVKLFPSQGNWSENEYLGLADTNRLVELSEGNIKVLDMATTDHQDIVGFLYRRLFQFVETHRLGRVNFAPLPVWLWEGTLREPDVLFMAEANRARVHKQFWNGADLVMEVVTSDRKHDLETKRSEYARGRVPEYWIADPESKELTVLRLVGDGYEVAGIYHPGDQAESVVLAGFKVEVAAALGSV